MTFGELMRLLAAFFLGLFAVDGIRYVAGIQSPKALFEQALQGEREERAAERREYRNDCICGDTQSCPFGLGIVGEQRCQTDSFMVNRWSRCEPAGEKSGSVP